MMVAVSKVEDDKSVIIGTVDPNGLVAKYGLFKGLILDKVGFGIFCNSCVTREGRNLQERATSPICKK